LLLASDLGILAREKHTSLSRQVEEVRRTLTGLIQRIQS
jgi:hypothetical protein